MKRTIITLTVVAVLVGVGTAIVLAQFSDEKETAGAVSLAGPGAIDLYICEPGPQGGEPVPGPGCGPDDNGTFNGPPGADEVIFENIENLTPNDTTQWDIRLRNTGTLPWLLTNTSLQFSNADPSVVLIQEVEDPGPDCTIVPVVSATILGKAGDEVNDNVLASFFSGLSRESSPGSDYQVRVAAGDYEDLRLRVTIPANAGNECIGSIWDIIITWTTTDE